MKKELISISFMLKYCVLKEDDDILKMNQFFEITDKGNAFLDKIINVEEESVLTKQDAESLLILLCDKYDVIKTETLNLTGIISCINTYIKEGKLLFPYLFDNILYQKYKAVIGLEKSGIDFDSTQQLLDGTPAGTYQFGPYTVGAFGVVESDVSRIYMPAKSIPLWHCPIEGCSTFHSVELARRPRKSKISEFLSRCNKVDFDKDVDLRKDYEYHIIGESQLYAPNKLWQLPLFMGSCFSIDELRKIFGVLLNYNGYIRKKIGHFDKLKGNAEEIANSLEKNEILQLLLLFENDKVANAVEECIDSGLIYIPDTEIRESQFLDHRMAGLLIQNIECSRYGIRVVSDMESYPINRLYKVTKEIYCGLNDIQNLNWKLSTALGFSLEETNDYSMLETVLYEIDPEDFIRKILFNDRETIRKLVNVLEFGYYEVSASNIDFLIKKVLWKLGYNISFNSLEHENIMKNLKKFKDVALGEQVYTDDYKNKIRSESINFFVLLEGYLQKCLFFTTWALLSDHYNVTRFKYNEKDAYNFSFDKLNGYSFSEDSILNLSKNGNDTLYPIIEGFRALTEICRMAYDEREDCLKDKVYLPSGSSESIFYFPFIHTSLIQDMERQSYIQVVELINKFYIEVNTSNVCEIRNATSHNRRHEQFPTYNEFCVLFNNLERIFLSIEELGLYPFVYNCTEKHITRYGKVKIITTNENGKELVFYNLGDEIIDKPDFKEPHIIVPLIRFRGFDAGLILKSVNDSDYTRMWSNFPNRLSR